MARPVASAEDRLRKLLGFQAVLAGLSRELGPATELDLVLKSVLGAMRSLVDFRGGTIQLVEGYEIRVAASDPPISEEVLNSRIPVGEGISGRVVKDNVTMYVPDVDTDERIDPVLRSRGSNAGMKSYLATPLVCLGSVIGLLQVDSSVAHAFDEDDRTVLEGLAVQVAGVIESARRHEAMRELDELRSDFVARVSHELRTPVAIVSGFVETLLSEGDAFDEAQRRHMLERVSVAVTRLASLVERMLLATHLEVGAIQAEPVLTDIETLLGYVVEEAAQPQAVKRLCPPGLRRVVDPKLLRQTLGLLVDNALAFAGDAEVVADNESIWVRDHGPGVDAPMRRHVFEQFVRGGDAKPGMGIGLHLARRLAIVCGIELTLEDPPDGVGALFRLKLPGTRRNAAASAPCG